MSALPTSAPHELLGPHEERSCFTCAHSPRAPGPAGCAALVVGDEGDPVHDGIVNYCEASGANADANPTPGWPLIRSLACPAWMGR